MARPIHCTSDGLTYAIPPNVGNSGVQFLIVGTAFALSLINKSKNRTCDLWYSIAWWQKLLYHHGQTASGVLFFKSPAKFDHDFLSSLARSR